MDKKLEEAAGNYVNSLGADLEYHGTSEQVKQYAIKDFIAGAKWREENPVERDRTDDFYRLLRVAKQWLDAPDGKAAYGILKEVVIFYKADLEDA